MSLLDLNEGVATSEHKSLICSDEVNNLNVGSMLSYGVSVILSSERGAIVSKCDFLRAVID